MSSPRSVEDYDLVVLITDHTLYRYDEILKEAPLILDTRHKFPNHPKVVRDKVLLSRRRRFSCLRRRESSEPRHGPARRLTAARFRTFGSGRRDDRQELFRSSFKLYRRRSPSERDQDLVLLPCSEGRQDRKNCSLGQNVNIGNNVQLGDNVKVQNNVSL